VVVIPPKRSWGGGGVFADGGVMSIITVALDPSVRFADTSPSKTMGRKRKT
jgi:hypothetical protein